jgi:hypothetical protein
MIWQLIYSTDPQAPNAAVARSTTRFARGKCRKQGTPSQASRGLKKPGMIHSRAIPMAEAALIN